MTVVQERRTHLERAPQVRQQLRGFTVQAVDGRAGKVEDGDLAAGYVRVNTGGLAGRRVYVPVDLIAGVDHERRTVLVGQTKAEIERTPDWTPRLI